MGVGRGPKTELEEKRHAIERDGCFPFCRPAASVPASPRHRDACVKAAALGINADVPARRHGQSATHFGLEVKLMQCGWDATQDFCGVVALGCSPPFAPNAAGQVAATASPWPTAPEPLVAHSRTLTYRSELMGRRRDSARMVPEDVLAGRTRFSAHELARLIRATNPTGLKLSSREMRRRYGQKLELQSLLVRTFPDDIDPVVDGSDEGIVLLHHRVGGFDACHAVVQELDEDARSIVQRKLDVGEEEPVSMVLEIASPDDTASTDVGVLIQAGREAAGAYDFELARSHLEAALDQSEGSAASGVAMLELLVEQIGLFHEALEVESRLSAEAMEQATIRSLLAKAAAYCGDRPRALALIQRCRNGRTAEVFAILARQAIDAGQYEVASADCRQCAEHDPACPALSELREALEQLDANARREAQQRAESLAMTDDIDALSKAVSELLARWPADAVGERLASFVQEQRALSTMREQAATAEALAEAKDWQGALIAMRRAIGSAPAGGIPEGYADKIALWEARQQELRPRPTPDRPAPTREAHLRGHRIPGR